MDKDLDFGATMTVKGVVRDGAEARTPASFEVGGKLLGKYIVLDELGHGMMGVVYRCRDTVGNVDVAVKRVPEEAAKDPGTMKEIRENFRLISKLRHENIAGLRVLEMDPVSGECFLVMDLVSGEPLGTWMRKHPYETCREKCLDVLGQVASALDCAHRNDVIHRDVKPDNIMVDNAGHVSVIDFGIAAKAYGDPSVENSRGTPWFKSPEQWTGGMLTPSTDQYALGGIAYAMMAGAPPFDANDRDGLKLKVLNDDPPMVPTASPAENEVLRKALAKKPKGRFPGCVEFVKALKEAGEAGNVSVPEDQSGSGGVLTESDARKQVGDGGRGFVKYLTLLGPLVAIVIFLLQNYALKVGPADAVKDAPKIIELHHVSGKGEKISPPTVAVVRESAPAPEQTSAARGDSVADGGIVVVPGSAKSDAVKPASPPVNVNVHVAAPVVAPPQTPQPPVERESERLRRQREELEIAKLKAAQDEIERKARLAKEDEKRRKEDEAAKRKAEEEEEAARRRAKEEEAAKRKAEEEAARRKEAEEAKRRKEEVRKQAEAEARRKAELAKIPTAYEVTIRVNLRRKASAENVEKICQMLSADMPEGYMLNKESVMNYNDIRTNEKGFKLRITSLNRNAESGIKGVVSRIVSDLVGIHRITCMKSSGLLPSDPRPE